MSTRPLVPPRLAAGGGTDYERRLLASAAHDSLPLAPSARKSLALRAALEAARSPASSDAARVPAPAIGATPWVVALVGLGVIGAVLTGNLLRSEPPAVEQSDPVAALVLPTPPAAAAQAAPAAAAQARSRQFESVPERALQVDPRPLPSHSPSPAPAQRVRPRAVATPREPGLTEEVRAIEHIQTLLGWGQAQQATAALSDYRRRFPRGELSLEADLLQVDAALARGDRAHAAALARALLERPAASGYRARLSELAAEGAAPNGSIDAARHIHDRR